MDRRRLRFVLALALFAGWVVALGGMAFLSADRPRPRPLAPVAQ
jgi:hypothetical protein